MTWVKKSGCDAGFGELENPLLFFLCFYCAYIIFNLGNVNPAQREVSGDMTYKPMSMDTSLERDRIAIEVASFEAKPKFLDPNEAPEGYYAVLKSSIKTDQNFCFSCDWHKECISAPLFPFNHNHRCSPYSVTGPDGQILRRKDGCSVVFKRKSEGPSLGLREESFPERKLALPDQTERKAS